jgi:hypothetical protein
MKRELKAPQKTTQSPSGNNLMNNLTETKLVEHLGAPEQLSQSYAAACHCSVSKEFFNQELEYLWGDANSAGQSYELCLGKISRNPIVRCKVTGKYLARPWSAIIKLALDKGIEQ